MVSRDETDEYITILEAGIMKLAVENSVPYRHLSNLLHIIDGKTGIDGPIPLAPGDEIPIANNRLCNYLAKLKEAGILVDDSGHW